MSVTLLCSDPAHASRSAEPGWEASLGTADAQIDGMLCGACAAHVPSAVNLVSRTLAESLLSDTGAEGKLFRALVLTLLDEINALRDRLTAQDNAVAAATSLTNLQTRWASVASSSPMPDRTATQARTAILNHLAAGDADS